MADKLWDIAAMLPEVGTVPYGRCCGRGGLSRCGFPIVYLAEMEAAKSLCNHHTCDVMDS